MNSLNIGIVGLGLMGERHVRVYDKMPLVNVYAVCDANEARAKAMAERFGAKAYTDLEQMMQDPVATITSLSLGMDLIWLMSTKVLGGTFIYPSSVETLRMFSMLRPRIEC